MHCLKWRPMASFHITRFGALLHPQNFKPLPASFRVKTRPSLRCPYSGAISRSSCLSFSVLSQTLHSLNRLDGDLEPYLRCSMPHKHLKVAVLLSGGVDSSVALHLLHAAGHSCTAFYLKIWFQEDFENFWSECPWDEDLNYAKAVCDQVEVPLEVVHLTDEYWKNVVTYLIEEYRCGRTPNPDVLCNTRIKFGAFMDAISNMGFDYIASGHYANVRHSVGNETNKPSVLELSADMEIRWNPPFVK